MKKFLAKTSARPAPSVRCSVLACLLLGSVGWVTAQEQAPKDISVVRWLGEPEQRLRMKIPDLAAVESQTEAATSKRGTTSWETRQFGLGEWSATTTFQVVRGRVKRLLQEATAPQRFCEEAADWGTIGQELGEELGAQPMVYTPTEIAGNWQQAALWHSKRATVVVYRMHGLDGDCRVRMTVQ